MSRFLRFAACLTLACLTVRSNLAAQEVVAFWGFLNDYTFDDTDTKYNFPGDVDNTVSRTLSGAANLQVFLGAADDLDSNGGSGWTSYTSPVSNITYQPTRTIKWDDLKSGGDDFDIGGTSEFQINKLDGSGPTLENFNNDALLYIRLDGQGFRDFQVRFDAEGTPGDLPDSFDVFYRVGGAGTWFRRPDQNNLPLNYQDYDPVDPENQFANSGYIPLSGALNNQTQIELIINDFRENGNDELEIDNVEIIANTVPEPTTLVLLGLSLATAAATRRSRSVPLA